MDVPRGQAFRRPAGDFVLASRDETLFFGDAVL
jgi:hypothetical protein